MGKLKAKKIMVLLLSAVMVLSLAGCGKEVEVATETTETTEVAEVAEVTETTEVAASIDFEELKRLCQSVRHVEMALGSDTKQLSYQERLIRNIARKSIVAAKRIQVGELFTEENLTTKRPGIGISPMQWDQVIGTRATKLYEKDDFIEFT